MRGAGVPRGSAKSPILGPDAQQLIGRDQDFTFGWIGDDETEYGRVLLLRIIPRPHMRAQRNWPSCGV